MLRSVTSYCEMGDLETILMKLWKIVKLLADGPSQIFWQPLITVKQSLALMTVLDMSLYHSFMAIIALTIKSLGIEEARESLDINKAFLTYLKPSNVENVQTDRDSQEHYQGKKGVTFGMFKMDCLALFG